MSSRRYLSRWALALVLPVAGCFVAGGAVPDQQPEPGEILGARFWATWDVGGLAGEPGCAAAAADTVRLLALNTDTSETFVASFPCAAGRGTGGVVTAGDYAVTLELLDCGAQDDCQQAPVVGRSDSMGPFPVYDDSDVALDPVHFAGALPTG
jgi:hypothetical protein